MKTADQIRHLLKTGAMGDNEAQTELMLDIRGILLDCAGQMSRQTTALETLVARWRKPGRPRKKKSGTQPAG